jgi:hypothetical protein
MMDWKALLKTAAPWLGAAIGGPLGTAAVGVVTDALGLDDKTEAAIKQALAGITPEDMLKLKTADQTFALQMQELGFKDAESLEAIAAADRKDARNMLMTTRSWVPAALSIVVTVGYFAVLIGMMMGLLKVSDSSQALLLLLGSLSTAWGAVMHFWLGSNNDSNRKTDLLAQAPAVK